MTLALMRGFWISVVMLTCIVGCEERRYSDTLTESATVVDVVYTPSSHGEGISPTVNFCDGSLGVAFTSIDVPAVYAVVFECQHGKFIVQSKDLWERMTEGLVVTVSYREVYMVDDKQGTRRLIDYDFLGAEPR